MIILGGIQKVLINLEHLLIIGLPVASAGRQQRRLRLHVAVELVDQILPNVYLELIRRLNGLFPGFQLLNGQFPLRVALIVPQVLFRVLQVLLRLLDLLRIRHPFPLSRGGVVLPHRPLVPGVQKLILLFQNVQLQLFQLFAPLRLLVLLLQSVYLLINGIRLGFHLLADGVYGGLRRLFPGVIQFVLLRLRRAAGVFAGGVIRCADGRISAGQVAPRLLCQLLFRQIKRLADAACLSAVQQLRRPLLYLGAVRLIRARPIGVGINRGYILCCIPCLHRQRL